MRKNPIPCTKCGIDSLKIAKGMCHVCYMEDYRRSRGVKPQTRMTEEERKERKRASDRNNKPRLVAKYKASGKLQESKRKEYEKNKAAYVTRAYNRYLKRKQQTLACVRYKDLQVFYDSAKDMSSKTGIKHNVDHIIPLKHGDVCGLNVPWNLQVLTEFENKSKNDKFDYTYDNLGWKNGK